MTTQQSADRVAEIHRLSITVRERIRSITQGNNLLAGVTVEEIDSVRRSASHLALLLAQLQADAKGKT